MNYLMKKRGLTAIATMLLLASAGMTTTFAAGLMQSDAKVDATVTRGEASESRAVQVRLAIADGWHVNAHPASLEFLVPTTIEATANGETVPLTIAWPEGHDSGIELGDASIMVYSDGVVIPVGLDNDAADSQPTFNIRVQACSNKGMCLPPSTLQVQLQQS